MSRRVVAGLSAAVLTFTAVPAVAASSASVRLPTSSFPLGIGGAASRTGTAVAPGVTLFTVRNGKATQGWTVTLIQNGGRDYGMRATAEAKAQEVADAGFDARVEPIERPAVADYPAETIYAVRVGRWTLKQRAKADKVVKELKEAGLAAKADYIGDDGAETTGPWDIRVLTVDPKTFRGGYRASLGTSVAKRETTSAMSKQVGAIAGINGGFFNIHTSPALRGEPVGISVVGGRLLSEAVPGRSALVIQGRKAKITEVKSGMSVSSDNGNTSPVHGVNRAAKFDELVLYTAEWGAKTPENNGTDAVLDAAGQVVAVRASGGAVPKGGRVLHGSGAGAGWMQENLVQGSKVTFPTKVIDLRTNRTIPLNPDTHVVGGGVGLVRNGKVHVTAKADGHASVNMILRRHPRSLVGVTKSGGLILAVVDGRNPGVSVGASFTEAAKLMKWLGARQAINFDGGGSSALVVKHKVVNRPSDGAERPVGDALFITN
ncbi:phosphodiester glycosidase family protein [Sinosporangium siamense]|uniref:Phosphodiester glycosidase domain-containing protein n=1 Tax=Sinosporangium siamense TaxID=1367973 RepID=A0A919V2C7_9ACTN|nr:phosphodiester glycosidase family protein [Sinosporangium siamense]GII89775.1 hypothetical protein Ssi02_00060 [Sinosporangium siamense]